MHLTAALLLALPSASASAQDIKILAAKVREQDARIRELEGKLGALLASQAAPLVPTKPSASATPPAPGFLSSPPAQSEDVTIKIRGRLQVDALLLDHGKGHTPTGTQVRRLYLGAEGKIAAGFRYQAEADFAGNSVALQDALVAYRASDRTEIVGGYFKPQITADDMTSDVHTLFLERSAYAGLFAPGRRVGIGANYAGNRWGIRTGLFGERESAALDGNRNEAWLVSARAHADLLPGPDVLHVAIEGYYTEPSDTDRLISLSQRPENNRAPTIIDTGAFHANHGTFGGAELAWARGALTVQAEGGVLRFHSPIASPQFHGYSVQASWRLTGEARPYDNRTGSFGRITPAQPLTAGGLGALEAGLRLTGVDLTDDGVHGGELLTYGAVINWYPVTRLRLSANLIHAEVKHDPARQKQDLLTVRGAVDW